MNALYAQLRLAWRPLTWLGALLVLGSGALPFLLAAGKIGSPLQQLWSGTAAEPVRIALWHTLAFLPPALGHIVALQRLELQHAFFSWQLPRLHERLATGSAFVMVVVAGGMAALLLRNEPAAAAVAGFALACYTFLLPGFVYDVAVPRVARILPLVPFAIMIALPSVTAELARTRPALVTAAVLPIAALQLLAIASAERARLRPFRWSRYVPSTAPARAATARDTARRWTRSLASSRTALWLRAAAYETGMRTPLTHLQYAAVAVLITGLLDHPFLAAFVACHLLAQRGHVLGMRVLYPLSRSRRAKLTYVGTLLDAAVFVACGIGLLVLSWQLTLPGLPMAESSPAQPIDFVTVWGLTFALAPFAQWGLIRWPVTTPPRHYASMRTAHFFRMIVFVVGVNVIALELASFTAGDLSLILGVIGGLAVAVQLVHAWRLHQYFTRGDLVPQRT